jgi:hypothetical protein
MYCVRGMFVTDPPFRAGANVHDLVNSFQKDRDDNATLPFKESAALFPDFLYVKALQGLQMVGTTCTLPEA